MALRPSSPVAARTSRLLPLSPAVVVSVVTLRPP
jgi:hypothetical protein